MPYFVSKDLSKVCKATPLDPLPLVDFKLYSDTEFTQKLRMIVDCVGLYCPTLIPDYALIFTRDELTEDFNPIYELLYYSGHNNSELDEYDLEQLLETLEEINTLFSEHIEGITNGRAIRQYFNSELDNGTFDNFINTWSLDKSALELKRIRTYDGAEYQIQVEPKTLKSQLVMFFAPADLFKIFGKNHQHILLESQLYQYRSLRFLDPVPSKLLYIDGSLVELKLELRDTMYRLPPVDKSLSGQSEAFNLSGSKLNLETREIANKLDLDSPDFIKENMSRLFEIMPNESIKYNAQDIFLTAELDDTQRIFLNKMRNFLGVDDVEIADTTGKNIANLIKDLLFNHFDLATEVVNGRYKAKNEDDKPYFNSILKLLNLSKSKNVQNISSNHFGIQPFLTVGGLLFSRMAYYPIVKGNLADLDLKSCYATSMAKLNVYIGEPKCLTFRHKKYKPTLREALELINSEESPNDAWLVRVSGELNKAINTLVMSDLRFQNKKVLLKETYNLSIGKKSIESFNAEKTSKTSASSTILLKKVKFGLINWNILEALKLLPKEWLDEYLELKVDSIIYVPKNMIVDNLDEYINIIETLPDEPEIEELNQDKKALVTQTQTYKNNLCLRFNIGQYWSQLRDKRNVLKKAKDPVQSVYKLAQNSGYGALACMYLSVNNLLASNQITAMARTNAWLMVNSLNGFSPITDGTVYSWDTLPYGYSFRELLEQNPNYLASYDPNIISGIDPNDVSDNKIDGVKRGDKWISDNFKQHLASFYNTDISNPLIELFDYELKDESFITELASKRLIEWQSSLDFIPTETEKNNYLKALSKETGETYYTKSIRFDTYINTNGANYVKGLENSSVLIDDYEYDLENQTTQIKARSFSSKRDYGLLPWYIKSVTEKYETPYIYEEGNVIKFGEGNDLAIRFLDGLDTEIAHPMGFSNRQVKLMKLISRSQFLFLDDSQLRNFERNEAVLADISKVRIANANPLLSQKFFSELTNKDLEPYGVTLIEGIDYYGYAKNHPVGIGFELLSLKQGYDGDISKVRSYIQDKIFDGCKNFNAVLNVQRSVKYADKFKYLLAAVIVKRKNIEEHLKSVLVESAKEPTILTVNSENIKTLEQLWGYSDD